MIPIYGRLYLNSNINSRSNNKKKQKKESEIQIMKQQIQMLTESQKEILEYLKYPNKLNQILNEK